LGFVIVYKKCINELGNVYLVALKDRANPFTCVTTTNKYLHTMIRNTNNNYNINTPLIDYGIYMM